VPGLLPQLIMLKAGHRDQHRRRPLRVSRRVTADRACAWARASHARACCPAGLPAGLRHLVRVEGGDARVPRARELRYFAYSARCGSRWPS
jgi:hypothetical protein